MPNYQALQVFYGTLLLVGAILLANWSNNKRLDDPKTALNARIDDLKSTLENRLNKHREPPIGSRKRLAPHPELVG
jgi:hypothetical protein